MFQLEKQPSNYVGRMIGILVVIASIAALKAAASVMIPLALAIFALFIAWPFQSWLSRRMPRIAAYALTLLGMVIVLAGLVYGVSFSATAVAQRLPAYTQQVGGVVHGWYAWLRHFGLPVSRLDEIVRQLLGQLSTTASVIAAGLYTGVEIAVVTAAYVTLGLWEAPQFLRRMRVATSDREVHEVLDMLEAMMRQYQRYVLVRTLTSGMIGVLTAIFCWWIGLDFAAIWGLLGFLLNYVPVVGAVVAVIPPLVFASIQFGGYLMPLLVVGVLFVIHFVIGNYVDPALQGRRLAMSPLVVLFSVLFWGWVWGIPGALLGIPMMVAIVVVTSHFRSTQWIALLLADMTAPPPGRELPGDDSSDTDSTTR